MTVAAMQQNATASEESICKVDVCYVVDLLAWFQFVSFQVEGLDFAGKHFGRVLKVMNEFLIERGCRFRANVFNL